MSGNESRRHSAYGAAGVYISCHMSPSTSGGNKLRTIFSLVSWYCCIVQCSLTAEVSLLNAREECRLLLFLAASYCISMSSERIPQCAVVKRCGRMFRVRI